MKKRSFIWVVIAVAGVLLCSGMAFSEEIPPEQLLKEFKSFRHEFIQAVASRNHNMIRGYMPKRFKYCSAFKSISRDEALKKMLGDKVLWKAFLKALRSGKYEFYVDSPSPKGCFSVQVKLAEDYFPKYFIFRKAGDAFKFVELRSE